MEKKQRNNLMTKLEELKAEADAARKAVTASHIAWKKAHADAATAVYSDAAYSNYAHAAYDANATYKAYKAARDAATIYCDAAAYAAYATDKVYQTKP
jgi:CRISPR/Cas system-associated exonuclease Cas4 (RecB family)